MLFSCTRQVNFKANCTSRQCENINGENVVPRPAKLGRVKTSRFKGTTKMRHPSTYDDATNMHGSFSINECIVCRIRLCYRNFDIMMINFTLNVPLTFRYKTIKSSTSQVP